MLRGFSVNQNGQGASWAIFHFIQLFLFLMSVATKKKRENCQKEKKKTLAKLPNPERNSTDKRVVLQERMDKVKLGDFPLE